MIAATNPLHNGLYGPQTAPQLDILGTPIAFDHGPLFYMLAALLYVFMIGSLAIILQGSFAARRAYRPHYMLMFALTLAPLVANAAYIMLDFTVLGFDPTPFMFAFVVFVLAWLIFTREAFDITSRARAMIFSQIESPVLTCNHTGQVLDLNDAAQTLFGYPKSSCPFPLSELKSVGSKLANALELSSRIAHLNITDKNRAYQAQLIPLSTPMGIADRASGWVIMLTDVSEHLQREKILKTALVEHTEKLSEAAQKSRVAISQAERDPMTGLLNRRTLLSTFEHLTTISPEMHVLESSGFRIMLLDIDHFKQINDTFGHAEGDRAIARFAQALQQSFRKQDLVYRLGGEEFLVLAPGMPLEEAHQRLKQLRRQITAASLSTEGRNTDSIPLPFSAGLASWPEDGNDFDTIFQTVDKRLYLAKARGRNRSVSLGQEENSASATHSR